MKEIVLIKYGEIILKGLNRHVFEDRLVNNIKKAVGNSVNIYKSRAAIYAEPEDGADIDDIVSKISRVFGIVSVTRAGVCEKEINSLCSAAITYLEDDLKNARTFKVESKRADKTYPIKSPDISREVGGRLLIAYPHLKVDVISPEVLVHAEVRENGAYVYAGKTSGPGGMPTGSSGKAMLLLSGGIDSPVAGYMLAKRGAVIEAVHFFSHPFTSERAKQKVFSLAKILAGFTGGLKVYVVPFTQPQLQMREKCPGEHMTLLMRRMMMMIACRLAEKSGAQCLVTGESLGQVASQTMEALAVTDDACTIPCFRPLIGMDKEDIVTISKNINAFETSILPYEDCCTIFVPKHPVTKPRLHKILESEARLDIQTLIDNAVAETETVVFKNYV